MGLISVDRKPTLLGTLLLDVQPSLTVGAYTPVWNVLNSSNFRDVAGNTLPAFLRFYAATVSSQGGSNLSIAFDSIMTSVEPSRSLSVAGTRIAPYQILPVDLSTLLGVVGVRRVLVSAEYASEGTLYGFGLYQSNRYAITATFYTAQQSA